MHAKFHTGRPFQSPVPNKLLEHRLCGGRALSQPLRSCPGRSLAAHRGRCVSLLGALLPAPFLAERARVREGFEAGDSKSRGYRGCGFPPARVLPGFGSGGCSGDAALAGTRSARQGEVGASDPSAASRAGKSPGSSPLRAFCVALLWEH